MNWRDEKKRGGKIKYIGERKQLFFIIVIVIGSWAGSWDGQVSIFGYSLIPFSVHHMDGMKIWTDGRDKCSGRPEHGTGGNLVKKYGLVRFHSITNLEGRCLGGSGLSF